MSVLLNFSLQCFHVLAWPLLAFGYPLYASIQAIEANSDSSTRKLITYWVSLSLLLLLDHAFYWLPYWPFVKTMIVGCLTIPCFEGSLYIYNRLMLSVDFKSLIKMSEIILEEKSTLTVTKIEPRETEPRGLQNLIASKGMEEQPEEIKVEELSGTDRELGFVADFDSKAAQTTWTCVLCKVKCPGKAQLISHFLGKKHMRAYKSLKAKPDAVYYFRPWTCELCKRKVKNRNELILHLQSKRHLAACGNLKMETKRSLQGEVTSVSP